LEPLAALEHLRVDSGKQFDPGVYEALVSVITRRVASQSTEAGEVRIAAP
jgi:HD-GYP domain-containing protein (c-di-GMP phosphodiesterase class II)